MRMPTRTHVKPQATPPHRAMGGQGRAVPLLAGCKGGTLTHPSTRIYVRPREPSRIAQWEVKEGQCPSLRVVRAAPLPTSTRTQVKPQATLPHRAMAGQGGATPLLAGCKGSALTAFSDRRSQSPQCCRSLRRQCCRPRSRYGDPSPWYRAGRRRSESGCPTQSSSSHP